MTNTKFRKRALLSSVAMLLVALVALGSATFAWFVDDPTADAKGLTAKAQSSTGLQIKTDSSAEWSHHADIAKTNGTAIDGIILSPAMTSTNDTSAWHSVVAAAANASDAKSGEKWSEVATNNHRAGNGVYMENITLRKTGDRSTAQDVYLSGLDLGVTGTMAAAVTVMLTDSTGTPIATFSNSTTKPALWSTAITDGTTEYAAPGTNSVTHKQAGSYASATDAVNVGTFNSSTETVALKAYVWLDGQNSVVKSDNAVAAQDIISKCNFYFTLGGDDYTAASFT